MAATSNLWSDYLSKAGKAGIIGYENDPNFKSYLETVSPDVGQRAIDAKVAGGWTQERADRQTAQARTTPSTSSAPAASPATTGGAAGPTTTVPVTPPAPDTPSLGAGPMAGLQSAMGGGGMGIQSRQTQLRQGLGYRTPPPLQALLTGVRY